MTTAQAKQTVLVSMIVLVGIAVFRGKSTSTVFKRVWGTGVIGVILGIVADFAPQIAGPFAALVVLGSLTNGGDSAIQNLLGHVPGSSGTGAPSPPAGAPPGVTGPQGGTSSPSTTPAGGAGPSAPPGPLGPTTTQGATK
jgi:hypothetical protein